MATQLQASGTRTPQGMMRQGDVIRYSVYQLEFIEWEEEEGANPDELKILIPVTEDERIFSQEFHAGFDEMRELMCDLIEARCWGWPDGFDFELLGEIERDDLDGRATLLAPGEDGFDFVG